MSDQDDKLAEALREMCDNCDRREIANGTNYRGDKIGSVMLAGPNCIRQVQMIAPEFFLDMILN